MEIIVLINAGKEVIKMFHAKDGWYFGRTEDGGVHIVSPNEEVRLDAGTWASAVASVSARGDTAEVFQEAQRLHSLEKQEIKPGDIGKVEDILGNTPASK